MFVCFMKDEYMEGDGLGVYFFGVGPGGERMHPCSVDFSSVADYVVGSKFGRDVTFLDYVGRIVFSEEVQTPKEIYEMISSVIETKDDHAESLIKNGRLSRDLQLHYESQDIAREVLGALEEFIVWD